MPTPKKTPKKRPTKTTKKPAATAPAVDSGEAAFLRLKPKLDRIAAERVAQPRAEVRAAASFVLSDSVARLKDRKLRDRFLSLPAAEFQHSALDDLSAAAEAALYTQAELAQAEAGTPGAMLPVELVSEATKLRADMLTVCEYHFRGNTKLSAQVEDIRSGQGYLDLAEDLKRLAGLYRAEKATLKQDLRFYRAADEAHALHLAKRITSELRIQGPQAAREMAWRAWALLVELYGEIERGAHFLLREEAATAFPPLHSVGRTAPRPQKKTPPAPTP